MTNPMRKVMILFVLSGILASCSTKQSESTSGKMNQKL